MSRMPFEQYVDIHNLKEQTEIDFNHYENLKANWIFVWWMKMNEPSAPMNDQMGLHQMFDCLKTSRKNHFYVLMTKRKNHFYVLFMRLPFFGFDNTFMTTTGNRKMSKHSSNAFIPISFN